MGFADAFIAAKESKQRETLLKAQLAEINAQNKQREIQAQGLAEFIWLLQSQSVKPGSAAEFESFNRVPLEQAGEIQGGQVQIPGMTLQQAIATPQGQVSALQSGNKTLLDILIDAQDPVKQFQRKILGGNVGSESLGGIPPNLMAAGASPESLLRYGISGDPKLLFEERNIREMNIGGQNVLVDLGKYSGGRPGIVGLAPKQEVGSAQLGELSGALAIGNQLGTIEQIAEQNPEFFGPLNALWETVKLKIPGLGNKDAAFAYGQVQGVFNVVAKLRSGAVLNVEEIKRLENELPSKYDTPESFTGKMRSFKKVLKDTLATKVDVLKRAGLNTAELDGLLGEGFSDSLDEDSAKRIGRFEIISK